MNGARDSTIIAMDYRRLYGRPAGRQYETIPASRVGGNGMRMIRQNDEFIKWEYLLSLPLIPSFSQPISQDRWI
jgi:hypothetical protein